MNDDLYNFWKDAYQNYFQNLVDFEEKVVVPEDHTTYSNYQNKFPETNELKAILEECNNILRLAHKRNIILEYDISISFRLKIELLKNQIKEASKSSAYDDGYILVCNDRNQIIQWKEQAKELLTNMQSIFLPLFFEKAIEYEEKVLSDKEQIETIKNTETINKLSSKFTEVRKTTESKNLLFIGGIVIAILLFIRVLRVSSMPEYFDFYYLLSFYLKRASILILATTLLIFLMKLRKEYFNLSQHYLHKEVLSGAFINFQEQIDKLPESVKQQKQELNIKLLEVTINELGKNPLDNIEKGNKNDDQIQFTHEILKELLAKFPNLKY
ncbi:hypothetical protein F9B74_05880 [Pelistega sp. NLN82]|uniref:Uncharacterized protein n=1 Tax=Pelistega ratti TaxID=2652177 RepID=A0A6L9Y7S0_9BURK|nr:hypothetical protein [Pelistega ratti]NEN75854.1 hypothetical protein [Pelistega ratti]